MNKSTRNWWRKLISYTGPGYLVSVGYMDPGNWATDIAGGAQFGYQLLSVIFISNVMAMLFQSLAVRFGVATGKDLAQGCRDYLHPTVSFCLWVLCEAAIPACALAELLGGAIALQLLFHIPLLWGSVISTVATLMLLFFKGENFRELEAIVTILIGIIGLCFIANIFFSKPDLLQVLAGYFPGNEIVLNPSMLYLSIGILGATVMPHNLYLHSALIQIRTAQITLHQQREAIRFGVIDSTIALFFALFINSAILIVAAATFHFSGYQQVGQIEDAYKLLSPLLGASLASTLFALALLASGQSSTLSATLAGQIVMEGFLHDRLPPIVDRLVTRLLAVVPAVLVILMYGERHPSNLIVFSQVVLSFQLPFAVIPLVMFTSDRQLMGEFVSPCWLKVVAWVMAAIVVVLNGWLLYQTFIAT